MSAARTGTVVSLIVSMALLAACVSPSPMSVGEVTPALVDSRPVLPPPTLASTPTPGPPTPRPTPGPPPTLAPAPALARPAATPSSAQPDRQPPGEGQPSTPATVASAVIGATGVGAVNMRSGPSTTASVIATLTEGTLVETLGDPVSAEGREWRPIRSGGRDGWVVAGVVRQR
jgi:hypothetical protein